MADAADGIDTTPGAWSFGGGVADSFDAHVTAVGALLSGDASP